jgi:hypothetical protein
MSISIDEFKSRIKSFDRRTLFYILYIARCNKVRLLAGAPTEEVGTTLEKLNEAIAAIITELAHRNLSTS